MRYFYHLRDTHYNESFYWHSCCINGGGGGGGSRYDASFRVTAAQILRDAEFEEYCKQFASGA